MAKAKSRKVYAKARYKENPERYRAATRRYKAKMYVQHQQRMVYLKSSPCADCNGKFPPECMDFDHIRGEKKFAISASIYLSPERIANELAKCELVCANCHRIRTKQRQNNGKKV